MKKYLVLFALVASCSWFRNSNNMMENQQLNGDCATHSERNSISTFFKRIKTIAYGRGKYSDDKKKIRKDLIFEYVDDSVDDIKNDVLVYRPMDYFVAYNENEDKIHQFGEDTVAYNKYIYVIADGLGSNPDYAAKMSSTMTYYAIKSEYKEPEEILQDACKKVGPAFKEIFQEVGKKQILEDLERYEKKLKNATNQEEIRLQEENIKTCKSSLENKELLDSIATFFCNFEQSPPATTINIATIDNGQLKWVNVGDSGLMVIRDGNIVHRSIQQRAHIFSTSAVAIQKDKDGNYTAVLKDYNSGTCKLKEKDILLFYTDGLSDNLPLNIIIKLISNNSEKPITEIIEILVSEALKASKGKRVNSFGGKKDDIAALMHIHKN